MKTIRVSLTILYDIVSLFWCYVIINSIIFSFSNIKIGVNGIVNGIDIIGGADISTFTFFIGIILGNIFTILFIALSIATAFLLTASIFKKQKSSVLLCILLALSLVAFILIPAQTYIISLNVLVRNISILKYSNIFYILISLANIITNIFFAIKGKGDE